MRRALVSILVLGLVGGVVSAPALAGKKKTIKKEFSAGPHAPLPILADASPNGCLDGQEGLNKTTVAFKTPGKGLLDVTIHEFEGDWDMYVTTPDGSVLAASDSSQLQGAAQEERIQINLPAKKSFNIVACNWAGGPTAAGHYTYKYKK
ncbi:MAG: hypothetical protein M3280_02005 [Actinomycetota bacterium]|nr:hypothetical protein [Actinomycetota bacterium]